MVDTVMTENAPKPGGPYSHARVANGFLFTAGLTPYSLEDGIVPEGIEAQTRLVLEHAAAVLAERGLDFSDLVSVTVHLQYPDEDFAGMNAAYREMVPEPFPARTTIGSGLYQVRVEMQMIAALRS